MNEGHFYTSLALLHSSRRCSAGHLLLGRIRPDSSLCCAAWVRGAALQRFFKKMVTWLGFVMRKHTSDCVALAAGRAFAETYCLSSNACVEGVAVEGHGRGGSDEGAEGEDLRIHCEEEVAKKFNFFSKSDSLNLCLAPVPFRLQIANFWVCATGGCGKHGPSQAVLLTKVLLWRQPIGRV